MSNFLTVALSPESSLIFKVFATGAFFGFLCWLMQKAKDLP